MSKAETTVMREMVDMSTVPPSYEETISGALNPTNAPPRYKREFDRRPAHQAAVPPHIARFNLAADRKAKLDATNLMMYIKVSTLHTLPPPNVAIPPRISSRFDEGDTFREPVGLAQLTLLGGGGVLEGCC